MAVFDFLQTNAGWMFGSGGLAAVVLAAIKLRKQNPTEEKAPTVSQDIRNVTSGGHVAGGNIDARSGAGPLELGIFVSGVVAIVGLVLFLMPAGTVNQATGGSVVTNGNGNSTTISSGN